MSGEQKESVACVAGQRENDSDKTEVLIQGPHEVTLDGHFVYSCVKLKDLDVIIDISLSCKAP